MRIIWRCWFLAIVFIGHQLRLLVDILWLNFSFDIIFLGLFLFLDLLKHFPLLFLSFFSLFLFFLHFLSFLLSLFLLSLQFLPSQKQASISVQYFWPGTAPEVIEKEVTTPLEGVLNLIVGIDKIYSVSGKGSGIIQLDLDKTLNV